MSRGRPAATALFGERGQSTVELALCLPFVALLGLLLVQIGVVVHDQILVAHAAREAARAAAVTDDRDAPRRAAVAGGGLDPRRLQVTSDGSAGAGTRVQVHLEYRSTTAVPLVGVLLPDPTLTADATMRAER